MYIMENQRIDTDGKHSDKSLVNNYRRQRWHEKTNKNKKPQCSFEKFVGSLGV
jgi:hypothetical protein